MSKSVSEMVFEATANTMCARIKALAPKLASPSGNSLHGRADCAKEAAEGLQQLASLMTDFFAAVASERAEQTGVNFSSKYFRDCIGDVFADVSGEFANWADEKIHEGEDA